MAAQKLNDKRGNRLNWFGTKVRKNEVVGVEFTPDGVAFAYIQRPATQEPRLIHCEFLPADSSVDPAELLRARLAKLNLQDVPCNMVLGSGHYQLILGEAPKVPAEELAEALRWKIKDLIQFPVADAVINAFLLPEDSTSGGNRLAYAVVAQRNIILDVIAQSKAAQLKLEAIDIPELAIRNLAQTCCDTQRGIALIQLNRGEGNLQIIRDNQVYLLRHFVLAYEGGLRDELPAEALILELQRSLDYFERQMRQVPPSQVVIYGENITAEKITPEIRESLAVSIDVLDLHTGLQINGSVQEHTLSYCLLAVGAALRQESVGVA